MNPTPSEIGMPTLLLCEDSAHPGRARGAQRVGCSTTTRPAESAPATKLAMGAALPAGCALGRPVVAGQAAEHVPTDSASLFRMAMRYVEWDDYQGLMEMARCGLAGAFDERSRCAFACDLKPGVNATIAGAPMGCGRHWLDVRNANLLQYAACIGAFRAASALIVSCPALLTTKCTVVLNSEASEFSEAGAEVALRSIKMGAADLVRFFCDLYTTPDACDEPAEEGVVVTGEMFRTALPVFELGEANPASLPYMTLPSVAERVKAAGVDPEQCLVSFLTAACAHLEDAASIAGGYTSESNGTPMDWE